MSVYIRGKKIWVSASIEGVRVRKSTKLEASSENLAYVKAHEAEFLNDSKASSKLTSFKDMAEFWLQNRTIKPLTLKAYQQDLIRHILPSFGAMDMNLITPLALKEWQNHLIRQGLGAKRINNLRAIFSGILNEAVALELITRNPFIGIKKPKGRKSTINPLSLDEIMSLLRVCDKDFKNVLKVAFFTGLRPGELIALKWSDIDFDRGEILVQRAIRHGELGSPKTEHSKRVIPIFLQVREALLELRQKSSGVWVFHSKSGGRLNGHASFAKEWKEALKRAGLHERVFYQTRHSFATMMLENGENLLAVAKVMGHSSPKITFERYTKATHTLKASFLSELAI